MIRQLVILFLILVSSVVQSQSALHKELQVFARKLPAQSALVLTSLLNEQDLFSHNPDLPLKPASVLKILTSYAVFNKLGPAYTFETKVAGSDIKSGRIEIVTIQGNGDPGFRIEELNLLVRRLRLLGIRQIDNLYLDDSSFVDTERRSGVRAYEAAASALAFNFNSLRIQVCPTQPGKAALVVADPFEYPVVLNGSIKTVGGAARKYQIDETASATYHLKGTIGINQGCADHYRSVNDPLDYLARVLARQLAEGGIETAKISRGKLPAQPAWAFSMRSRDLNSLVTDLNHYSSNFLAEQLIFALGADGAGQFSRRKGLEVLRAVLQSLDPVASASTCIDGSGLSHENRVPARLFIAALKNFWKNQALRVEFERSLAVQGRSGTLKTRPALDSLVVRAKTGSLNGVSSLVGYVYPVSNKTLESVPLALVIVQNGTLDRTKFIALENELLKILSKHL